MRANRPSGAIVKMTYLAMQWAEWIEQKCKPRSVSHLRRKQGVQLENISALWRGGQVMGSARRLGNFR